MKKYTFDKIKEIVESNGFELLNADDPKLNAKITIKCSEGHIKTVDIMDLIANDIRATARDAYIGKLSNSFDNKVLLMSAIHGYFDGLINDGLVEKNTVEVDIDMEEQKKYLKSKGVNLATMSDREIREANTGDQVFIAVRCRILDAIESISIRVFI